MATPSEKEPGRKRGERAASFRAALEEMLAEAEASGATELVVVSKELHEKVGGYPGVDHAMPVCCDVMRKACGPNDVVVSSPKRGKGASLAIRYLLPRPRAAAGERVDRSEEMILTAYFLARFAVREPGEGGIGRPPAVLNVSGWEAVYRLCCSHPRLMDGRASLATTMNSFRPIHRAFASDLHLSLKRSLFRRTVVEPWMGASEEALWQEVRPFFLTPPTDPPKVIKLKRQLAQVEKEPPTPDRLKVVQRLLKIYERPSRITRYVKRKRGSRCQLCDEEGFVKRDGTRYCEVHHLFHMSTNPPPDALGAEYLVVLCATCHRRMHYANVGEPRRTASGWQVSVDGVEVEFKV
jgi:5-methylcytosine-specific restriction protein A